MNATMEPLGTRLTVNSKGPRRWVTPTVLGDPLAALGAHLIKYYLSFKGLVLFFYARFVNTFYILIF